MKNTIWLSVLSALVMVAFAAHAQAKEYTVKMVSNTDKGTYYFEPKQLTIKSGDTVTWVNTGEDTHNVMAESVPATAEAFMSPDLTAKGQKWSYTFTKPGTYHYHCHPHHANGMKATITVDHPSKTGAVKDVGHHHDHGEHSTGVDQNQSHEEHNHTY